MSVEVTVAPQQSQLFIQGDARDPLGVWGARVGVTGDASGDDHVKATIIVPADRKASYIYTAYSVTAVIITVPVSIGLPFLVKCRLLTGWPNISPGAGVEAYSTMRIAEIEGSGNLSAPIAAPTTPILAPNDRFLLLFDPRSQGATGFPMIELEIQDNTDTATYAFEAYGYFWDRSVLQAPGGPRHPGAA